MCTPRTKQLFSQRFKSSSLKATNWRSRLTRSTILLEKTFFRPRRSQLVDPQGIYLVQSGDKRYKNARNLVFRWQFCLQVWTLFCKDRLRRICRLSKVVSIHLHQEQMGHGCYLFSLRLVLFQSH